MHSVFERPSKEGKETAKLEKLSIDKNDPHLQKLLEMIYANVSKRFQILSNAYCYLDFKQRDGVSL